MTIYFPLEMDLKGFKLLHWTKVKVGQEYLARVKLRRKSRYPKGTVNYPKQWIRYDTYFIVRSNP